jgi:Galactose oxidase, central domain
MIADSASTVTLLADGRVLLAGAQTQLYDPSTRAFTMTGNSIATLGCAAALLGNGKVLFTDDPPPWGVPGELYNPATGAFELTGPYASAGIAQMNSPYFRREGGWGCRRSTRLADGRVLIAGGFAAEIYDPQTNTFSLTGAVKTYPSGWVTNLPAWSDPPRATLLLNGTVLFNGGDGDFGPSTEAWLYDPSSGTFQATGPMTTPRSEHAATLLPDGTVFVTGSYEEDLGPNALAIGATEFYDPASATFLPSPDLMTPRFEHTATLLADGRVLIAGGLTDAYPPGSGYIALSSTEIYTPRAVIPAPRLFSLSGQGGQGAIWQGATGQLISPQSPASAGDVLSMYVNGLAPGGLIPPQVSVGGLLANVLWFGDAPVYPGYFQVNFQVPSGVTTGEAVPVRLSYFGRSSNAVTIDVQ